MEENVQQEQNKKKKNKIIPIFVTVAVLLIGGGILAATLLNTSAKEDYFLAEKSTYEQLEETVKSRYENELAWLEHSEENAIETVTELTAEMNNPSMSGMGIDQMVNNANITIESATDLEEKKSSLNLSAGMNGIEINGIEGHIDNNDLFVGLPFLDQILQVNGNEMGRILHEIDPMTFNEDETIDFTTLFQEDNELLEHLQEEYASYVYEQLPEDAFESSSETTSVNGEEIDAEKIVFHLPEEEMKLILQGVFDKAAEDDALQEMLINQLSTMNFASMEGNNDSIDIFSEEFQTAMEEASANVEDIQINDGLNSTIWVADDIIVKRDFSMEIEMDGDTANIAITGTNAVTDTDQTIEYDIMASDGAMEETVQFRANLSHQDGQSNDSITLAIPNNASISLEANQTIQEEKNKEFEYIITGASPTMPETSLHWTGEANFEGDQLSTEHTLFAEDGFTINKDFLTLFISQESSTVDQVESPSGDQVKNLNELSGDEVIQYFETEVEPQFSSWVESIMGPGVGGF